MKSKQLFNISIKLYLSSYLVFFICPLIFTVVFTERGFTSVVGALRYAAFTRSDRRRNRPV